MKRLRQPAWIAADADFALRTYGESRGEWMYHRILLPLDASELAEAAIPHALANALAHDAAIHLLQVVDPADLGSPLLRATLEKLGNVQEPDRTAALEAWEASAREYLDHVAGQLRDEGVEVTVAVRQGNPFEVIPEEVATAEVDLVVIASHGRSGLGRALLGSVADHVVRHVKSAPVLIVQAAEQ